MINNYSKGPGERLSNHVQARQERNPKDDLNIPPRQEDTAALFPPVLLKPELDEQDIEDYKTWKKWATFLEVPEDVLDRADKLIQFVTWSINRSHITIKTEDLVPMIKHFLEIWKPSLSSIRNLVRCGTDEQIFWAHYNYGVVMKLKNFQSINLLKNWTRMRSRRTRYENVALLTYALRQC